MYPSNANARPLNELLFRPAAPLVIAATLWTNPAAAQVDQQRAAAYFKEAAAFCEREGGRLWGVSLCGPMVFADAATQTIATNEPEPDSKRPAAMGFANAAMTWGDKRWSIFVWQMIPADPRGRARLLLHELFHRVQPELGLMTPDGVNDHLDSLDGRYWLQLEWRALAKALASSGPDRTAAVRDALAFRLARRNHFPESAENERRDEIREGLAQYTATVACTSSMAEGEADAITQLKETELYPTFVRTFGYPSGAAYGLLLDASSPGWTRRVKNSDDLGQLVMAAARLQPADDVVAAAARYDGPGLRQAEEIREAKHKAHVAELRRRFVDGPVLIIPGAGGAFSSQGVTAIPGAGTVYPKVRVTAEWGTLEAAQAMRTPDRSRIIVPAPAASARSPLTGDGWTLKLAPGWIVRAGTRAGDYEVVRDPGK